MPLPKTISYYLRSVLSTDLPSLIRRRLRNGRYRRQLGFIRKLAPLPVPATTSDNVSIHLLTSHYEWQAALWSARSLLISLGRPLPVVVHDDGSLCKEAIEAMQKTLPGLTVLTRDKADALAEKALASFPECRLVREQSVMGLKLLDPWLMGNDDVILIDSDVLWFSPPPELKTWLAGPRDCNYWNEDINSSYSVDPAQIKAQFNVTMEPRVNCGLGFVARASIDLPALESFLVQERPARKPWLVEQTAYAYLSSRYGVKLLPPTYAVGTAAGKPPVSRLIAKHYVGSIRNDFYLEGLPFLSRRWLS